MNDTARRFRTTVRLDEAVMRLAERTAAQLDVTIPVLIETLLLDYLHRADNPAPSEVSRPRPSADVVELDDVRRRRKPA